MKPKFIFTFHSLITLLFGCGILLIPQQLLSVFGVALDPSALHIVQFAGVGLISLGLLAWVVRHLTDGDTLHEIFWAFFLMSICASAVLLLGQITRVVNWLGWLPVAVNLLLALNYAHFLSDKAEEVESPTLTHRHQH